MSELVIIIIIIIIIIITIIITIIIIIIIIIITETNFLQWKISKCIQRLLLSFSFRHNKFFYAKIFFETSIVEVIRFQLTHVWL